MNLQKPNYKAWLISEDDFPQEGSIEEKAKFLTGYGVLAPSQHNTQPWLFEIKDGGVMRVRPNKDKMLHIGDPENRGLYLALGACVENILQAGEYFGVIGTATMEKDAVLIRFKEGESSEAHSLARITNRHSDKSVYSGKRVEPRIARELELMESKTVELKIVDKPQELHKIKGIHVAAAESVADNPAFVRELTGWLRPNRSKSFDGMPGFVTGVSNAKSVLAIPLLRKKPQLFKKALAQDEKLFSSAPLVAIWGVKNQTAENFIECGRLVERFWLRLIELGLAAHPMAASVSNSKSAKELADATQMQALPIFVMRVGYHDDTGLRTPRRSAVCN